MTSIFPDYPKAGGLPVRDGAGNPTNPPEVEQAYSPAPAFVSTCPITALPSNCDARIEPKQINAIVSEMLAFAECLDPNGPWDCANFGNLCRAFQQWTINNSWVYVSDSPPAVPIQNQLWFESDTGIFWLYYNDGNSIQWVQVNGIPGSPISTGTGVTDGDKGDIVVSGTGTIWQFDPTVVTAAGRALLDDTTAAAQRTTLGAIGEAPNDGQGYVRNSLNWAVLPAAATGIGEAPNDGSTYARQSLAWTEIPGIGGISPTEYTFSTTAGLPPSSGQLRINNVSQPAVTALYLHKVNAQTVDVANALRLLQSGNILLIQDKTNSANYQYYTVTGALTEAATYFTVPVIRTSGGAAFTPGRVMVAAFGMGATAFPEAPTDGQLYYRRGSTGTWVKATVSTAAPSGGVDGDIWYQYV